MTGAADHIHFVQPGVAKHLQIARDASFERVVISASIQPSQSMEGLQLAPQAAVPAAASAARNALSVGGSAADRDHQAPASGLRNAV
jgi:hypothetical protein